jgi:alpha-D-ribose 1-methylphosphonate 5-triphosphate synthase subunit PhnI
MYIAVKGGERAIEASRQLLAAARRGDTGVPALEVAQIEQQLGMLVGRVMAEASLYDPHLAALALRQACGDAIEAAFLLRAYRTTLPRFAYSEPIDTDRMRLQNLARGDEGFLLALGYSTQRGYGTPSVRRRDPLGEVAVEIVPEELGFPIEIGEIELTECQMVNQFAGSPRRAPSSPAATAWCSAAASARRWRWRWSTGRCAPRARRGRDPAPAQDEEFVLPQGDSVEASGFVQHLKLPHYVDFQSELS